MSVLVAGGAGYVGSVLIERLLAHGDEVVCLDDLSLGHRDAVDARAHFVEGSLADAKLLSDTMTAFNVDSVVHCAARSIVGASNRDPLEYFETNVVGTHVLCRSMMECGVFRLVLSSTAAVYGEPETFPIDESHSTHPVSAYGRSKRMIEEMLEWHARAYDFRYLSLRYFNAAGASARYGEDHTPETHLVPIAIDAARSARKIQVYGDDYATRDGTCVRDFVHVEDLADAHVLAISDLRGGGGSDVINLGSGEGHTVLEVLASVGKVTGRDVAYEIAERRPGDPPILVASNGKAESRLGWSPSQSSIERIVSDAWKWREAHPRGYAR